MKLLAGGEDSAEGGGPEGGESLCEEFRNQSRVGGFVGEGIQSLLTEVLDRCRAITHISWRAFFLPPRPWMTTQAL